MSQSRGSAVVFFFSLFRSVFLLPLGFGSFLLVVFFPRTSYGSVPFIVPQPRHAAVRAKILIQLQIHSIHWSTSRKTFAAHPLRRSLSIYEPAFRVTCFYVSLKPRSDCHLASATLRDVAIVSCFVASAASVKLYENVLLRKLRELSFSDGDCTFRFVSLY